MKHLILCSEYPPVPTAPGGIGTYVFHLAQLLAEAGETVHVISQLWQGAPLRIEHKCQGKLIIHRVPSIDQKAPWDNNATSQKRAKELEGLLQSPFPPQGFSWQASLLAEQLVEQEEIDIIESQEYLFPLYYFQLRRALGLGPKKHPPCLIHLHSPSEFIGLYNQWDLHNALLQTVKRLESYSIATADALLCPSQFFARQAEVRYALETDSIKTIPLPLGNNSFVEREAKTWENGTICYVGRLEERKGIVEWLDAAVAVAPKYPSVQFEFFGTNCLGDEFIQQRIPADLSPRFHFRGKQKRSHLPQFLQHARIAVVPSRWENFPNTCVEAMCSGLPVIASRQGGMVEMIEDNCTGWLAKESGSEGLAEALERALQTPPDQLSVMGRAASASIRQLCDNQKIVEEHIAFRQEIVKRGAKQSLSLPANLPWIENSLQTPPVRPHQHDLAENGVAIVLTCFHDLHLLNKCWQRLQAQTQKPIAVVMVAKNLSEPSISAVLAKETQWLTLEQRDGDLISAKNRAIQAVLSAGYKPLGFAFLETGDHLEADFIAHCQSVLQHCPEVGLISSWAQYLGNTDKFWFKPCPSFPYQWFTNEVAPFSVVRSQALYQAGYFCAGMAEGFESWHLANTVMVSGWVAVTLPEILGTSLRLWQMSGPSDFHRQGVYYRNLIADMMAKFPDLIERDAIDLILLARSDKVWSKPFLSLMTEANKYRLKTIIFYSQGTAWYLLTKFGNKSWDILAQIKRKIEKKLGVVQIGGNKA
jgi:glycogen(starch) synthase